MGVHGSVSAKPYYELSVDLSIREYHDSQWVRCLGSCRMFSHNRREGKDCIGWLTMDYSPVRGKYLERRWELKWKPG